MRTDRGLYEIVSTFNTTLLIFDGVQLTDRDQLHLSYSVLQSFKAHARAIPVRNAKQVESVPRKSSNQIMH